MGNPRRCEALDYIQFLIASQKVCSSTEAARVQPESERAAAHDAFSRLLSRQPLETEALWQEAEGCVNRTEGVLIADDTTLDKPYARQMDLVSYHWSGKHRRVVKGINLLSLLWHGQVDNESGYIPTDFRVYDKPVSGKTKNAHLRDMLTTAKERGFNPKRVMFDSWYASLDNFKLLRTFDWSWLARLKSNRQVNPDDTGNVRIDSLDIPDEGLTVHLKGYGFVKVYRTVLKHQNATKTHYWATDDLEMDIETFQDLTKQAWSIETYHRGIKQFCGIEKCQARLETSQRNHILLALRAFLRLEFHRIKTASSWFEAKTSIIRHAIRSYLENPTIRLSSA